MATSIILGPDKRPIELATLDQELAAPSTTGIRQVWHASAADGLTPRRLARILSDAASGQAHDYLTLAEEMEERYMHYASVLGTRKMAITGLEVQVDSATDDAADIALADALREVVATSTFSDLISNQVDAIGKGYAVDEILWDRSQKLWTPHFVARDQRWFRYDDETGRELLLIDEESGGMGSKLAPYKFIVHTPKIRSGLPIRGGLARLAAVGYMCHAWTWRDWMAFADIFGLPMRVGTYDANATQDHIDALIRAVANLGSDAAGVISDKTAIHFEAPPNVSGSGDFFAGLAKFWDENVSKACVGQTMTTDSGSSRSQAEIHDLVRLDIRIADARALSATLQQQLVLPYINLNFGPPKSGKYPKLHVVVPRPKNLTVLVTALQALVPLGLEVEQSVIRDLLQLPDPPKGAVLLRAPPPAMPIAMQQEQQPQRAINREAADAPDFGAMFADRMAVDLDPEWGRIIDRVRAMVDSVSSLEDLRAALLAGFDDLPADRMAEVMAMAYGAANLAGRFDTDGESDRG